MVRQGKHGWLMSLRSRQINQNMLVQTTGTAISLTRNISQILYFAAVIAERFAKAPGVFRVLPELFQKTVEGIVRFTGYIGAVILDILEILSNGRGGVSSLQCAAALGSTVWPIVLEKDFKVPKEFRKFNNNHKNRLLVSSAYTHERITPLQPTVQRPYLMLQDIHSRDYLNQPLYRCATFSRYFLILIKK